MGIQAVPTQPHIVRGDEGSFLFHEDPRTPAGETDPSGQAGTGSRAPDMSEGASMERHGRPYERLRMGLVDGASLAPGFSVWEESKCGAVHASWF